MKLKGPNEIVVLSSHYFSAVSRTRIWPLKLAPSKYNAAAHSKSKEERSPHRPKGTCERGSSALVNAGFCVFRAVRFVSFCSVLFVSTVTVKQISC